MAQDEKGTGKHLHKSTEEPHPHTKSDGTGESNQSHGNRTSVAGASGSHGGSEESESADLKKREYRDKEGNIHHHTHTAGKSGNK